MTYWEGMIAEGLVNPTEDPSGGSVPEIASRQAESGADVIDLQKLIRESREAQRAASAG